MLADETEIAEDTLGKLQFLERVDLLVGRLFDECAVAVDKEYSFHFVCLLVCVDSLYFLMAGW